MLNNSAVVNTVYHIGDIHIRRNNERDKEYIEVFERLINEISTDTENAIVLCTGDVFNDGLSPTAIMLAKNFFMKLCELCDVIVFRGNHDQANKSNSETMDFLFPVLYKLKTKNKLHILDKTGAYTYGNIMFGYTDVYDHHVFKIEEKTDKVKIGLWHGIISGSRNDEGIDLTTTSKFSRADFECYDYVMLGDIHKMQYIDEQKTIAYCGSLIQQCHGETLRHHGCIKWDLLKKVSKFIEINNDYGYVTIDVKKENFVIPELPENVNLRIIHSETSDECIQSVYSKISENTTIIGYENKKEQNDYTFENSNDDVQHEVHNDEMTVNRLIGYISDNYENKPEEIEEITNLLRRVIGTIDYKYETNKKMIRLKSLIFDNFNVYGGGNCIDYTAMRGIVNVCGKNGIGKSSMAVHVLLYAIYGICEDSTVSKYDYINNKKYSMTTSIILDVNGNEYRILRTAAFKDKKRVTRHFTTSVILFRNDIDISGKDIMETNKKIIDIVGTSDDLINLCIMEQKKNMSFLDLSDQEKKDYICSLLKLDIYNNIHDVLVQEVRAYNAEIQERNKRIYDEPKNKTNERSVVINEQIHKLESELRELSDTEATVTTEYIDVNRNKIENDLQIKELSKTKFVDIAVVDTITHKIMDYETQHHKVNEELNNISKRLTETDTQITKYDGIEERKKKFDKQIEQEIDNINREINELWKGYADINMDSNEYNDTRKIMDELIIEKNNTDKLLISIAEQIKQLQETIDEYEKNEEQYRGYRKYTKYCELLKNAKQTESVIQKSISELIEKKEPLKKRYERNIKSVTKKTNEYIELVEQLNMYKNMEKKNDKFEKDKSTRIDALTKEIQEKMKQYEKVTSELEQQEINKLLKENEIHQQMLQNINSDIKTLQMEIDDTLTEDIQGIQDKYDIYIGLVNKLEQVRMEKKQMIQKLDDLNSHAELLKKHRYNPECAVCMSNDITRDKIETNKKISEMEEVILSINSNEKQIDNRRIRYEKYDKIMRIRNNNVLVRDKIKVLTSQKEHIELTISVNESKVSDAKENDKRIRNNTAIDTFVTKTNAIIKKIRREKNEEYVTYNELVTQRDVLNEDIAKLKVSMQEYEQLMHNENKLLVELSTIKNEIIQFNEKCETYIEYYNRSENYNSNKQLLEQQKLEYTKCENVMDKIILRIDMISKKMSDYKEYENTLKNNEVIKEEIKRKKIELKNRKSLKYDEYDSYMELVKLNTELTQTYNEFKMELKEIEIKLLNIKKEYENCNELFEKKKRYDILLNSAEKINEEFTQVAMEMDRIKMEISTKTSRLYELTTEIKTIEIAKNDNIQTEKKRAMNLEIIDIIKNGFVDNLLTKKIIPNFCANVNGILSAFVNYKIAMEYNNKKLYVYKEDANKLLSSATKLSGYETLMANIAFRLAINDINKLYKTNFFIIDEAFSFCDEHSIAKISNLFTYMRKIYDFVIVVSHNEQIKSYTDIELPIVIKDNCSCINMITDANKDTFKKYNDLLEAKSNTETDTKKSISKRKIK